MKVTKPFSYAALALSLALSSCSKKEPSAALAEVDGTSITEETYRYWWERSEASGDSLSQREATLEKLIERTALVNKAKELGLDQDPAVIAEIESLLIAKLKETELQKSLGDISISEQEAKAHYQANLESFTEAEKLNIAVLWFNTRGEQVLVERYQARLEQQQKNLEAIPAEDGFGSFAITSSEHKSSRFKGGKLGWIENQSGNDVWRNQVLEIASQIEAKGDVSPIVANQHGLFLVRLIDRSSSTPAPFTKVQASIMQRLTTQKRAQLNDGFIKSHGTPTSVEINTSQLKSLSNLSANSKVLSNR